MKRWTTFWAWKPMLYWAAAILSIVFCCFVGGNLAHWLLGDDDSNDHDIYHVQLYSEGHVVKEWTGSGTVHLHDNNTISFYVNHKEVVVSGTYTIEEQ